MSKIRKIMALCMLICMMVSMTACGNESSKNEHGMQETQSDSGENDSSGQEKAEVESLQFWLAKVENRDEEILSIEDIKKQNALMMKKWGTDWKGGYYDINTFTETVDKEWLQDRIDFPNIKNAGLYYKGEKVTEAEWQERYKAYAFNEMPEKITVKYGVIVHSTPSFDFPTTDIMTGSDLNEAENLLQQTYFRMNEPVLVLWESLDKNWYYVVANEFIGWIEAKDCALFDNRADWLDFQAQKDFLVVTEDSEISGIEGTVFMSTKLYLAEEGEAHGLTSGDYFVRVPQRSEDGKLYYTYTSLDKEEKVHEGYLPYTIANTLTLAFQELGEPYGWGGIDGKRDCSMYIKDIYSCFGFSLPRNSRGQMAIPEMKNDMEGMSVKDRETLLSSTNPGAIMGISGHVMLYLGEANGQHYVISMLGSYIPETVTENFGDHIVSVQKVMVNTLDVKRRNGNTWLQELISVVDIK